MLFRSTFAYSDLSMQTVHQNDPDSAALEAAWARGEASPNVEGGSTAIWLHRPAFEVSFTVNNTGKVKGGEVRCLPLLSLDVCVMLMTCVTADSTAVPALPAEGGRTSERAPRILGCAPRTGREQDRDYHLVALRPQRLGQRRAGLA